MFNSPRAKKGEIVTTSRQRSITGVLVTWRCSELTQFVPIPRGLNNQRWRRVSLKSGEISNEIAHRTTQGVIYWCEAVLKVRGSRHRRFKWNRPLFPWPPHPMSPETTFNTRHRRRSLSQRFPAKQTRLQFHLPISMFSQIKPPNKRNWL